MSKQKQLEKAKEFYSDYQNVKLLIKVIEDLLNDMPYIEASTCPMAGALMVTHRHNEDAYIGATPWWEGESEFRADICYIKRDGDDLLHVTSQDFAWTADINTDAANWLRWLTPALAYLTA